MPAITKNEAILEILQSAGFQQITLKVVPKLFTFAHGSHLSELEFSRTYFETTNLVTLQRFMREQILPAIEQHAGKRIRVSEHGIRITLRPLA